MALFCLFFPKVYIILFHPDKNVRKLTMNSATYKRHFTSSTLATAASNAGTRLLFLFLAPLFIVFAPICSLLFYPLSLSLPLTRSYDFPLTFHSVIPFNRCQAFPFCPCVLSLLLSPSSFFSSSSFFFLFYFHFLFLQINFAL